MDTIFFGAGLEAETIARVRAARGKIFPRLCLLPDVEESITHV